MHSWMHTWKNKMAISENTITQKPYVKE